MYFLLNTVNFMISYRDHRPHTFLYILLLLPNKNINIITFRFFLLSNNNLVSFYNINSVVIFVYIQNYLTMKYFVCLWWNGGIQILCGCTNIWWSLNLIDQWFIIVSYWFFLTKEMIQLRHSTRLTLYIFFPRNVPGSFT